LVVVLGSRNWKLCVIRLFVLETLPYCCAVACFWSSAASVGSWAAGKPLAAAIASRFAVRCSPAAVTYRKTPDCASGVSTVRFTVVSAGMYSCS
jgi:hypothetical protein